MQKWLTRNGFEIVSQTQKEVKLLSGVRINVTQYHIKMNNKDYLLSQSDEKPNVLILGDFKPAEATNNSRYFIGTSKTKLKEALNDLKIRGKI